MNQNCTKVIFLFFLLLSAGCDSPTESSYGKYIGTWQWLKSSGGFAGREIYPDKGITVKIIYGTQYSFKVLQNDSLKVQANYRFEKSTYGYDKIVYSNIITFNYYFYETECLARVSTDTLISTDGYADGYTSYYKKIR